MLINKELLDSLSKQAKQSPRLRQNLDLRTSPQDSSQRMLNALHPGTIMPVHRHVTTSETCIVLRGSMTEIFYDNDGKEVARYHLSAGGENCGLQIPAGQWHSLICDEPCLLFEAKDGLYKPLEPEDVMIL